MVSGAGEGERSKMINWKSKQAMGNGKAISPTTAMDNSNSNPNSKCKMDDDVLMNGSSTRDFADWRAYLRGLQSFSGGVVVWWSPCQRTSTVFVHNKWRDQERP